MASPTNESLLKAAFDGTWRPDYSPGPDEDPDVISLVDGMYECRSCRPPYGAPADGREHDVEGHPCFETVAVTVVDERTVRLVGRRGGVVVFGSTSLVAADGRSRTETWTAALVIDGAMGPVTVPLSATPGPEARQVLFTATSVRVGSPEAGAHLLSGSWKVVARDLLHHDEDTVYRIEDGSLTMTDRLGRSFTARLDGTVAPYRGDPRFDAVSLRVIDDRTIEESNLNGGVLIQVTRWRVDPDGVTMHVRFDDTHGHVMEQTGQRVS